MVMLKKNQWQNNQGILYKILLLQHIYSIGGIKRKQSFLLLYP